MSEFELFVDKVNEMDILKEDDILDIQSLLHGFFQNDLEIILRDKYISEQWYIILNDVNNFIEEQKKINFVLDKNKVFSQNKNGLIKKTSFELGQLISEIFEIEQSDRYFNILKIYFIKYEKFKILAIYDHSNKDY